MLARENLKVIGDKKWFLLVLFVLSVCSFTVFQVIAADQGISVAINGQEHKFPENTTVGQALEEMQIELTTGALLDVEGQVIQQDGGGLPVLTLNGQKINLDAKLKDHDQLAARTGENVRETIVKEEVPLSFAIIKKGKGTETRTIQLGQLGLKMVEKGSISGKVVAEQVIKEPVNKIIEYYTLPKPSVTNQKPDAGSSPINDNVVAGGQKTVTLTFDDGPGIYTPEVLSILEQYKIKAVFFMVGLAVEQYPDIARMVVAQGHQVGNHTIGHRKLTDLSLNDMTYQIMEGNKVIKSATGVESHLFRPPGGRYNPAVLEVLNQHGYKMIMWSIDPRDWDNATAAQIENHVLNHVRNGSIILLHDGGGNRRETIKALPGIISGLQKRGYTFVTL